MSKYRSILNFTAAFLLGASVGFWVPRWIFATPLADSNVGRIALDADQSAVVLNLLNENRLDLARQILEGHLRAFLGAAPTLRTTPLSERARADLEKKVTRAQDALGKFSSGADKSEAEKK